MEIVYNVVVDSNFNKITEITRDKFNLNKEDIVFAFVGRLNEKKGLDNYWKCRN